MCWTFEGWTPGAPFQRSSKHISLERFLDPAFTATCNVLTLLREIANTKPFEDLQISDRKCERTTLRRLHILRSLSDAREGVARSVLMVGSCVNTGSDPEVLTSATYAGEHARFARADVHGLLLKPAMLEDSLGSLLRCCELSMPASSEDSVWILMLLMRRTSRGSTRGSTRGRFCPKTSLETSYEVVSPRLLLIETCAAEHSLF